MTDYTFAFGENGYILNVDNNQTFPFIDINQVSGLDSAPLRMTTQEHQGMDGTYVDTPFMSSRTIVLSGVLYSNPTDNDTLLYSLRDDYQINTVRPFYFQLPNQPMRFINCQGGGLKYDIDTTRRLGLTNLQFTLLAEDPYIYDYPPSISQISSATIASVGTGFNESFNLGFGGTILSSGASVTNNGTHTAYPLITIVGPVTNPVLADSYSGITMAFNISLAAGDQLVIDCRQKSVVLNGTVSRRSTLAGLNWISVPSGVSDTIFFSADSGTGSCTVTLWNTYY